ncbi:MAG: 5-bromo-4-chloroindolyl phosphate hydrolysis family protein [Clostridia bacterium]|jgi:5-bromo-4-chloroindolyl phosphate hydrolysis protein|nr:5-bromo-4-chloroindolyl phosphate hydrolysis family protein [Clostridia bacterium]
MEIRHKSAMPIYLAGAVWVLYCLIFSMHKLFHIIIALVLFVAAYLILRKKFPDRVEIVEETIKYTGAKEIDQAIEEGNKYLEDMRKANELIESPLVSDKIDSLSEITKKIFNYVSEKPQKLKDIRRFLTYFLPTTVKLLNSYARAEAQDNKGENINQIKNDIEGAMDGIIDSFHKHLDNLYADEAMDIDAEITVFDSMLKAENLK